MVNDKRLNTFMIKARVFNSMHMVKIRIKILVMNKWKLTINKLVLGRTYLMTEPSFTNSADKNCHKCPHVHDCISFRSSGVRAE